MTNLLTNYNFLRSFGEPSALEQLTDEGRLSLLKTIISTGPSETSWRAILELFASWPESKEKVHTLQLTNERLASWDENIRTVNSAWTYLYDDSKLASIATIVRVININRREQNGNKELTAIVSSAFISELIGLTVFKSEISPHSINTLVDSPFLQNLKALALDGVTLRDNAFTLLADASNLPQLKDLRLRDVGLNSARLNLFLNANLIRNVSNLDLSYNNLDDEAVDDLLASIKRSKLNSLSLEGNFLRAKGALKLIEGSAGSSLRELNIDRNEIADNQKPEVKALSRKLAIKLLLS